METANRPAATAPPLSVRVVTSDEEFLALAPRWSHLLERSEGANNFLSHEWLHAWWRSYRPAGDLRLILAEGADGTLAGIAPLFLAREKLHGIPFRVLRFVGDGTAETDHMNFLVDRARRGEVLALLLERVGADPGWDAARLNQIPKPSPNAADILAWASARGFRCEASEAPCPIRRLPPTFDALLASLQSRFRGKLRSTRKRLEEKYRVEFGLHADPAGFPEALEILYRNHASRWAGKGQHGVFVVPARRAFYEALARDFHARGWLRFFHLKLDGVVVAQEFCFEYGGVIHLLQEGFDFARAEENIGNALRGYIMEWAIREGKSAYDFLAGTSRHKGIWSDGSVPDLLLEICRPTLKGRIYHALPRLVQALKDRVKAALRKPDPSASASAPAGAAPSADPGKEEA